MSEEKVESKKFKSQKDLFWYIWQNRPHQSEVSGKPIPEPKAQNFAHILSKGAYPSFKLLPKNIALLTAKEHHLFDNRPDKVKHLANWRWLFNKRENLLREYYKENSLDL